VDGVVWCVSFQPALGGGGGSQGFQDVLIVDPDLTQDNVVDGGANDFRWENFDNYRILVNALSSIRALTGGESSTMLVDANAIGMSQASSVDVGEFSIRSSLGAITATMAVNDTGNNSADTEMTAYDVITTVTDSSYTSQRYQDATAVTDSVVLATNTGEQNISPTVSRMAQINGVNEVNFLVDFVGGAQRNIIRTAGIIAGTKVLGYVFTLKNIATGQGEWEAASGGLSNYHAPFNIDCNSDTVNASTTSYYNIYPGSGVDGTEATRQNIVPVGGTAKGYAIQTLSAQGASGSLVFTMRKNGANTTLTVTVAAGSAATIVADNVNSFAVTKQSDLLSYQVQNNSTGTSAQIKSQSFVIESNE